MAAISLLLQQLGRARRKGVTFEALGLLPFTTGDGDDQVTITKTLLNIDATLTETHKSTVEVTDHQVESGANITDHIVLKPVELSIEGVVSDSPLNLAAQASGIASAGTRALGAKLLGLSGGNSLGGAAVGAGLATVGGSIGALLDQEEEKSRNGFLFLQELQKQKKAFTVVTSLRTYQNMVLVDLSVPRTAQNGRAIRFTASLKEIRTVSSLLINLPEAATTPGGTQKNKGGQETKKSLDADKQVKGGVLYESLGFGDRDRAAKSVVGGVSQ